MIPTVIEAFTDCDEDEQGSLSTDQADSVTDYIRKEPVRFGSVRFGSVPDFSKDIRFGSVWFGNSFFRFDAVRPALFIRVVARSGSVRFRIRSRLVLEFIDSVRFGSAGSVRFLITSC